VVFVFALAVVFVFALAVVFVFAFLVCHSERSEEPASRSRSERPFYSV
jgi:hypothetical protein